MKKMLVFYLVLCLILLNIKPAQAAVITSAEARYCYGPAGSTNSAIYDISWIAASAGVSITNVKVSWNVPSGDSGLLQFKDVNGVSLPDVPINFTNLIANKVSVASPAGSASSMLILNTGPTANARWLWYNEIDFSNGDTMIFPDPLGVPTPSGGTTATNTDIVNAINALGSQLATIIANQGTLAADMTNLGNQLTTVTNNQTTMLTDLANLGNQLGQVVTSLGNLTNYVTTPTSASPLNTSSLGSVPTFNSSVPSIPGEPNNQPYTYTTPALQLPTFVASPSAPPTIPDPSTFIMPHDVPKLSNSPLTLATPITPQTPATSQTPVAPQSPLTTSPVTMDPPLTLSPVQHSTPITPQTPIAPSQPYTMQTPIPPQ